MTRTRRQRQWAGTWGEEQGQRSWMWITGTKPGSLHTMWIIPPISLLQQGQRRNGFSAIFRPNALAFELHCCATKLEISYFLTYISVTGRVFTSQIFLRFQHTRNNWSDISRLWLQLLFPSTKWTPFLLRTSLCTKIHDRSTQPERCKRGIIWGQKQKVGCGFVMFLPLLESKHRGFAVATGLCAAPQHRPARVFPLHFVDVQGRKAALKMFFAAVLSQ